MNKDEIKKALECCITLKADSCKECPYGNTDCSSDKLQRDALNLITEQENEIEKQNSRVKCLKTRLANKMVLLANVEEQYEYKTKRFEEEKQELATALKQAEDNYSRAFERLKSQQLEIAELKAEKEKRLTCDFVKTAQKQAKIDVLNELKERLQDYILQSKIPECMFNRITDELIKELKK